MQINPQAIFFDFDGVIVESAEIKTEAFLELFKDYTELMPSIKEHLLSNMGVSRFKKFEWIYRNLIKRPLTETELKSLGKDFSNIVLEKILRAPFVPGAISLLDHTHKNSLCFVASGTPEDELKDIVEKRKLTHYFKEVCGTPRTKSQIVMEMIEKYNLLPSRCWFIGDANTDHEAAKTTGLVFIARNSPVMNAYWNQQENIWKVDSLQELKDQLVSQ